MNQTQYKNVKEDLSWLEQNPVDHKWFSGRYNVMYWSLLDYARNWRTEAGKKRCVDAMERFKKIRDKRRRGDGAI